MSRILVVDDEPSICWGLSRLARSMGLRVDVASSAEQGLALAAAARPDALVLDVRLPGVDGLTAMDSFRCYIGEAPIIVMTAFGDLDTAVSAVGKGAFEYVVKPFDLAEIRAVIERALRGRRPGDETTAASSDAELAADGMIGSTPLMHAVFKKIALAASSGAAVLLQGESGVGKKLAARAIHRNSPRRDKPFVTVNAGALCATSAEEELFGSVSGAGESGAGGGEASGGHARGLLVMADGGTLFIDEPADLPAPLQARLVAALDRGEVLPVGAMQPVKTRVHIVSASTCDLREAVQAGKFRHDLYLRLATFVIALPPLRDRRDDISLLAQRFAAQVNAGAVELTGETLEELRRRPWHGNVSELRRAVEHALVVARSGAVLPMHLPEPLPPLAAPAGETGKAEELDHAMAALATALLEDPANSGGVYDRFLEEVEPPLLATALSRHGNRCAPAARALGLHRTTLKRKLDQYGIDEAPGER